MKRVLTNAEIACQQPTHWSTLPSTAVGISCVMDSFSHCKQALDLYTTNPNYHPKSHTNKANLIKSSMANLANSIHILMRSYKTKSFGSIESWLLSHSSLK